MTTSSSQRQTPVEPDRPRRPGACGGSGIREAGIAVLIGLAICVPFLGFMGLLIYGDWSGRHQMRQAQIAAALAYERLLEAAPGDVIGLETAMHGRSLYMEVCAACHRADAGGVNGLGRNLRESDFVAANDDAVLHGFLVKGRLDTNPPMPPRGGRNDLADSDIDAIVAYLRCVQDSRRAPEMPEYVAAAPEAPSQGDLDRALEAAGGDAELAEYIAYGQKVYMSSCQACHGSDARGVPGNGKSIADSAFVRDHDDDALLAFLKRGRDPSDPANTTGVGMPAKGGNPALDDDDLLDVIAYLRSLQPHQGSSVSLGQ